MLMTSPDGQVLDIPDAGLLAMTALGWMPVVAPEDAAPAPRARRSKTTKEE